MRAVLLSLLLACSLLAPLRAEEPPHSGGGTEAMSAFSAWITHYPVGVTSSVQDLLSVSGIYIFSTGTAGTGIAYQFAPTNGSTWSDTYPLQHGGYFIKKRGRYIRVLGIGNNAGRVYVQLTLPSGINIASSPGVQPTSVASITLTATSAWTYTYLTCTAQPCNIKLFNQSSASTLVYWIDRSSDTPAFAGMSITPGTLPVIEDIAPGDYLHWQWTQSWTGNGFMQNRY